MLYPSGDDTRSSASKWAAGPTALALKQSNGWTYGMLANHLWSYAQTGGHGASDAGDASDGSDAGINATFLQPFVSYTTKTFTTFGLNTESTYDWTHSQWTVPLNASVSQLVKLGKQPVQFQPRREVLRRRPSRRPRLGPALRRHVPVPEMSKPTTDY